MPKVDTQLLLGRSSATTATKSVNTSNLLGGSTDSNGSSISMGKTIAQNTDSAAMPDPTVFCTRFVIRLYEVLYYALFMSMLLYI